MCWLAEQEKIIALLVLQNVVLDGAHVSLQRDAK